MPFMSGPHACSFWDYASFYLILLGIGFGPILLGILLIPPLIG
jgi:hypothetical protein